MPGKLTVLTVVLVAGCGLDPLQEVEIPVCTAGAFLDCEDTHALFCNGHGDGAVIMECGSVGCNMAEGRCNVCVADQSVCVADAVQTCGSDGTTSTFDPCPLGCSEDPEPHCRVIVPSYAALADACDPAPASTRLEVAALATLEVDTGDDAQCTGGIVTQVSGPQICVVRAGSITIAEHGTLVARGPRALALIADRDLAITGTLDVSADGVVDGPGGGGSVSGGSAGIDGGGGAGGKHAGAAGGTTIANGGAANGGAVVADPADLVSLAGGARVNDPRGGGGGGAVLLVACRGQLSVGGAGMIDAGGGGGDGGFDSIAGPGTAFVAGAGGGAGGYIVLEAVSIVIDNNVRILAHGGAGGGGTSIDDQAGARGDDASHSFFITAHGGIAAGEGGTGGNGGHHGLPENFPQPTIGRAPVGLGSPGGGGGSIGFLQAYLPEDASGFPGMGPFEPRRALQTR